MPTRPAHSDPITSSPTPHTRTHDVDPAGHLMTWRHRKTQPRQLAFHELRVGMAHAARLNHEPNLPKTRLHQLTLGQPQ
jgi:hypothetical protein